MSLRRAPGEGSVTQRTDGRWQASLQLNGTRRTVYGKTRTEALRKLGELRRQAAASGVLPDPGRRTVGDLLTAWLEAVRPNLKPSTAAHYELLAHTYLRPSLDAIPLAKLTPQRIQAHLAILQDRPRVAQLAYHVLKGACGLGVRWAWLGANPCDKVIRPQYRPRRKEIWTLEQLQAFLAGARAHPLFPLWLLLISSGIRLGEALALEWRDLDFASGTLKIAKAVARVRGRYLTHEPKTPSAVRTVTLPAEALAVLRQHLGRLLLTGPLPPLMFPSQGGGYLHRAVVAHALRQECQRLGLLPLTPHGLRHLHASLLLAQGTPVPAVSARLGHANPAVTLAIYSHALAGQDDQATLAIGRAIEGGWR